MGKKHRIHVTKEELERYERSLRKPRGQETPLASTAQALDYLGPLKQPQRIRAPSAERRRPRATRPMTPRTAARRARLVANKSPMREAGPRGYLCEVPSSARGRKIVARRRAAAKKDLPVFDDSRRQAARTLSATVRRRSAGSAGYSRASLWTHTQRPASAAASTQPASAPWDRATLPPAPSTCSLRPQRSMISEGDREARLALRDSLEAASRQRLLTTMASNPRPFTAPAVRTRRTHASPDRSQHDSPRSFSGPESPEPGSVQAENASVQTPGSALGHHAEYGAVMLEIICAEGLDAVALSANLQSGDNALHKDLESSTLVAEKMKSHCRATLDRSTWLTNVALGDRPEWRHQKTTFVADTESCIVLDILSSMDDTQDLTNDAHFHSNAAIRVSSLPMGSSERWYPLLPYTGECIPVDGADSEPLKGVPRVLLRTQFSPRAADSQEQAPTLYEQLHAQHLALVAAAEGAAGQLSVRVLAARNLRSSSAAEGSSGTTIPQDSFAVVAYDGTTSKPGPVVFGTSQPQWDMSAGPFSVAPAESENDHGEPPLIVRIHKWRSLRNSNACSAAYELLGVASIDVRHAIHQWSYACTTQQERHITAVEAWVALHTWASPDDAALVNGSCHPSAWHNPHRRLDSSGEVLVRLTFEQSHIMRIERPLPHHTNLQVSICQCHRLMGDLQSSVRVELSMHSSTHLATRKPPFPATCESWSTRIVDEMFSPTFFETFSFSLQCATACLRLDVYEISQPKQSSPLKGGGSPRAMSRTMSQPPSRSSPHGHSGVDSADAENHSAISEARTPSRSMKQKLLCSAIVPFMSLLSTPARHWYKLISEEDITHQMHSSNVDKWLEPENLLKHPESLKVQLPHGAVQFSAKMSGVESTHEGEVGGITSTHIHRHHSAMNSRQHARVTIRGISVEGLPKVQATGRTGTGTDKLIEPSPMVRFSFGQTSRQTPAHKHTNEANWDDVLHLPFSWLDDGDGDPEPEELQAEMKVHGPLTCKVYHRATPNATVREQLIGSATLSLSELVSRGGNNVSLGPRTYTIFSTVGHGARQLRATGRVTLEATVEFEGKDQLGPGELWEESDGEEDDTEVRGNHLLAQPHMKLRYMLRTAAAMRSIPIVTLEPELINAHQSVTPNQPNHIDGQGQGPAELASRNNADALTSLQLTVHSMQYISETVTRPVCRVYVTSAGHRSPAASPHGSVRSGSSLRAPAAGSASVEDTAFLLWPDTVGQLSIEKTATFNLPSLTRDFEIDPNQASESYLTEPESTEVHEDRVLTVEVFENVGALESEVVLGALYGCVSLPVAQAFELQEQGQNWHRLDVASNTTFADQQKHENDDDEEELMGIPALQLSLAVASRSAVLAPNVISAASRLPPSKSDSGLDDEQEAAAAENEGKDSTPINRLGHKNLYHGPRKNIRIFYDTTNLNQLDDINEVEEILLDAKEIWSRHHHFEYEVEDLEPIVLEVFAKFKRGNLSEEWEKRAAENLVEWVHLYRGGTVTHWTFKTFCKFWREVIDDTVSYAIRLGETFRDFYFRAVAAQRFAELDTDGSGSLEGQERTAMVTWILVFFYGENPPTSVQREMEAEIRHFQMRLDADGDSRITFDELHQYIFEHIRWMELLQARRELAQVAAMERATAVLQSAARGWLQRRALRDLLRRSIPQHCQDAMLFISHIPLADAKPHIIRSWALKHWGATRAVAVRPKDNDSASFESARSGAFKEEAAGRCWAIVWMESKDNAALALDGQKEAVAANQQHFGSTDQRQFHIHKCDLRNLHSKKAVGVLSEIWRLVPMAVVKRIPASFAEEDKLKDVLSSCGAVEAIVLENLDGDESWALVTFRHERAILKAISQPIEAGVNVLVPHRATFQQLVSMNDLTVLKQRGWDDAQPGAPGVGLTGAMAGLKGARAKGASGTKEAVRETAEEIAAKLIRGFKTNPANVERIVDRRTSVESTDKTSADSFAEYYDPANKLRRGGGGAEVLYKVVWQGRFVSASWVTKDMLLQTAVTRGMVYEYEDNLAD